MIHSYTLNGYNIVLDVDSGAIHVLDKLSFELLSHIEPPLKESCPQGAIDALSKNYHTDEIKEAYSELYSLYKQGLLFSSFDYSAFAPKMKSSAIKAMCIHIAHDCNLRCDYCFAAKGDFGHGRKLMDFETGKAAIDFLIEHSEGRRNLEIDFFGGEPLMNIEVIKKLVKYARGLEEKHNKNFRFTITTNGLTLNQDSINFINKEMSNAVLSIDGRPHVNDKFRVRIDGRGSYDKIVPLYQKLVSERVYKDYYVRGTFTNYNLDFAEDVKHLNSLGFDQISIEPVVSERGLPYSLDELDLPVIFKEYEKLSKELIKAKKEGRGYNFFHFMLDLDGGPCAIKRLRGCGAGSEYVAVTPEGDIYPCHQFVGMDEWKMGSVLDGKIDKNMTTIFADANLLKKEECQNCWAKYFCSGGCNANNQMYAGNINTPHKLSCEMEKKRLECAIMIKVALSEN